MLKFTCFIFSFIFITLVSCRENSPSRVMQNGEKNAVILLKSNFESSGNEDQFAVKAPDGQILIHVALINIAEIEIEHQFDDDSDLDDAGENEENLDPDENRESEEILIEGPFRLDIISEMVFADSMHVWPGTVREFEIEIERSKEMPFNGSSIVIEGDWITSENLKIPFRITSRFQDEIDINVPETGIDIEEATVKNLSLRFNFDKIFNEIKLSQARIFENKIMIDNERNKNMLKKLEKNLTNSIQLKQ